MIMLMIKCYHGNIYNNEQYQLDPPPGRAPWQSSIPLSDLHLCLSVITAFTSARQMYVYSDISIQSITKYPTSCSSIIILLTDLGLLLPSGVYTPVFPTKTQFRTFPFPKRLHTPSISFFPILSKANFVWAMWIIKHLTIWFPSLPCYIIPLSPKYSPQRPIIKHPLSTFLPQC